MPRVEASVDVAGGDVDRLWAAVRDSERYPSLAGHVLGVVRRGGQTEWCALLNGSRVSWVQRETTQPPRSLRFEQVHGDFAELRGRWTVDPYDHGVRLRLEVEFQLGVDGLAALLDPIWAQSLQAHAATLVHAVAGAALPGEAT